MNKLNNNKLKNINGGGAGTYVAIGGIIIFIIGILVFRKYQNRITLEL